MVSQSRPQLSPESIFETLNAYQRTAALKAGIELDVFTAIGEGTATVPALAARCHGTERGIRILCDYLTIIGFLTKRDGRYGLTPESAAFLDRRSPAFMGSAAYFLALPETIQAFTKLAEVIRSGRPGLPGEGSIVPENPIWVEFARSMAAMQHPVAEEVAQLAATGNTRRVLDLAAGHGMFGIAIAKNNPRAEIYAQDWKDVLSVAMEHARAAGVESRMHLLPGSAFDVDFGTGFDVVLITNFLHHFDAPTNESLLRKVRAALAPGGRVMTLDFVPHEDRVSPPRAAAFSMMMLGMTPAGDAYTFSEYDRMFRSAGFSSNELVNLQHSDHSVIVSRA